ncbi:MAG: hypothetical protein WC966_11530 [Bradymonadales bacterium]
MSETVLSIKTTTIIKRIDANFVSVYKNATPFYDSGELWEFCIRTIANPVSISCIAFANDLGIPPVASLLLFYQREFAPSVSFKFSAQQSQFMGALMGFVFKFVLNYEGQKERCTVSRLGVKTATRFINGPAWCFE